MFRRRCRLLHPLVAAAAAGRAGAARSRGFGARGRGGHLAGVRTVYGRCGAASRRTRARSRDPVRSAVCPLLFHRCRHGVAGLPAVSACRRTAGCAARTPLAVCGAPAGGHRRGRRKFCRRARRGRVSSRAARGNRRRRIHRRARAYRVAHRSHAGALRRDRSRLGIRRRRTRSDRPRAHGRESCLRAGLRVRRVGATDAPRPVRDRRQRCDGGRGRRIRRLACGEHPAFARPIVAA